MPTFTQDETSPTYTVADNKGIKLSVYGANFGGGTVSVQDIIDAVEYPLLSEGVPVALTAEDSMELRLKRGDQFNIKMTGSTTPAVTYRVTGAAG